MHPKPAKGQAPRHCASVSQVDDRCMPDEPSPFAAHIVAPANKGLYHKHTGNNKPGCAQPFIPAELVSALRRAPAAPCGQWWAPWSNCCAHPRKYLSNTRAKLAMFAVTGTRVKGLFCGGISFFLNATVDSRFQPWFGRIEQKCCEIHACCR